MTTTIPHKEISKIIGIVYNVTNYITLIQSSKTQQELNQNLGYVEQDISSLDGAKDPYIAKRMRDIDVKSKQNAKNKVQQVEFKLKSLYQEANSLYQILTGIMNYASAVLRTLQNETYVDLNILRDLQNNLNYADKELKNMLDLDALEGYTKKAVNSKGVTQHNGRMYVCMDKRGIRKLHAIRQNIQEILQNAR